MQTAYKFLNDQQIKPKKQNNYLKYTLIIPESQYFKSLSDTYEFEKFPDGRDGFKIELSANFTKPYK